MNLINTLQIPTSKLDLFIRSVEISSYLPGRVRLRSSKLISNPALEVEVQAQLGAFPEIASTETSTVTGSILIKYEPASRARFSSSTSPPSCGGTRSFARSRNIS